MDYLITALIVIIVAAVFLWILGAAPFMDAELKAVARWLVLVICALYLLGLFLGIGGIAPFHILRR